MVAFTFASQQADMVDLDTRKSSARTKVKLLAHGIQDSPGIFNQIHSVKEENYAYDLSNWGLDNDRIVPSEILLPGGIVSKLHVRPESPLTLYQDGDHLYVREGNSVLSEAEWLPVPEFWGTTTQSGVPARKLAQFYGASCLNINIYSGCQFFGAGKQCFFCSVQPTQQTKKAVVIHKSPTDLSEVCQTAVKNDQVDWILLTGGSYLNSDREIAAYLDVIHAIRDVLPWNGRLRGNVALMPPKTRQLLDELYSLGVDHPSFNLECWPRDAFERLCPGKAHYVGFDHIMDSFDYLVEAYGPGRLWCNFVAGLVPIEDQKAGFTAMAERGVIPGANVYHPDVGSVLGNSVGSPGEEYIVSLYTHAADLYHRYGYRPFFDSAVLRNSLANEAYEGLL